MVEIEDECTVVEYCSRGLSAQYHHSNVQRPLCSLCLPCPPSPCLSAFLHLSLSPPLSLSLSLSLTHTHRYVSCGEVLIKHGANVDTTDPEGNSALQTESVHHYILFSVPMLYQCISVVVYQCSSADATHMCTHMRTEK